MDKQEGDKKRFTYLIAGGLALILIAGPIFGFSANMPDDVKDIKREEETFKDKAEKAEQEANSLTDRLAMMDEQIELINEEVEEVEKELKRTKEEIKKIKIEITKKEEELAQEKQVLRESIKYIYEEGEQPFVSLLLSSKSFSEALDRTEYLTVAQNRIANTISRIELLTYQLEDRKYELEDSKQGVEELKLQLKVSKEEIKKEKKEKKELLEKTKGDEERYEKLVLAKKNERQRKIMEKVQKLSKNHTGVHYDGKPNEDYRYKNTDGEELERDQEKTERSKEDKKPQAIWPLKNFKLTQKYGCTSFAQCGDIYGPYNGKPHNGIDIASGKNKKSFPDSRVKSIMEGEVIVVSPEELSGGWGNLVVIGHPNGQFSLYGHLSRAIVKEGQKVQRGQLIGFEGNTGFSTGRHLHFSIYMKITIYKTDWYYGPGYDFAYTLNPENFLPKKR